MGKLARYLKPRRPDDSTVRSSGRCDACGWDFSEKHPKSIVRSDGVRKEINVTRDQIRIPVQRNGELVQIVTRCGDCYERELFNSGKSRWSGVESVETAHRHSFGSFPNKTP